MLGKGLSAKECRAGSESLQTLLSLLHKNNIETQMSQPKQKSELVVKNPARAGAAGSAGRPWGSTEGLKYQGFRGMGRGGARKVREDGYGLSDGWVGLNGQTLGVGAGSQDSGGSAGSGLGMTLQDWV